MKKVSRIVIELILVVLFSGCSNVVGDLLHRVTSVTVASLGQVNQDEELVLSAEVLPADATEPGVSWTSSDPAIATIDFQGKVTGLNPGNVKITVTTRDGNKSSQCDLTVIPRTSISGTVYAPNGLDPLPGILVYIPAGPVQPLPAGVTFMNQSNTPGIAVKTKAITDNNGHFLLKRVPAGNNIPLVIQLGKWRRQLIIPTVLSTQDNPQPAALLRLPKNKSEGDIPLVALVSGAADSPEIILRRFGVSDSEFTLPTGTGRIHFYRDTAHPGATLGALTPSEDTIWSSQAQANRYDLMMLACPGFLNNRSIAYLQVFNAYLNAGGRILTSHYGHGWLNKNMALGAPIVWNPLGNLPNQSGILNQSSTGDMTQWLWKLGASATLGQVPLVNIRRDVVSVSPPAQVGITVMGATVPVQFTFDTPLTSGVPKGGRLTYVDFDSGINGAGKIFPAECPTTPITPQERLMEYLLVDLLNPLREN